jgi:hypothetical protein
MALNKAMSRTVRQLIAQVAKEEHPKQLRQLVIAINRVLDSIEKRAAKLDRK